jgi:hypothetical protein
MRDTVIAVVREQATESSLSSAFELANKIGLFVATIVGSIAGYYGIRNWRKQLRGTHEFELALKSHRQAIRLKNAIEKFRNPMRSAGEIAAILEKHNIKVSSMMDFVQVNVERYILAERWTELEKIYSEYREMRIDSDVMWGDQIKSKNEEMEKIVRILYASLDSYMRFWKDDQWLISDTGKENNRILTSTTYPPDADKLGPKLEKVYGEMDVFFSTIVRK